MPQREAAEHRPEISFGVPVYNGEETIRGCLDSLLAQDFADFEVVVCDNASTDRTLEIAREYAAKDPRVRVFANPENVGQIANVNRVFELARGRYFRWIGVHDWLEPEYASRCSRALDEDPEAIAATCNFRIHLAGGESVYREYAGERLESPDPARRLARMLWFFHAGDALYDPLYSLIRRSAMERTARIRMMACADWMLAAELSLLGRFVHLSTCLAHREKSYAALADRSKQPSLMRRYHPTRSAELPSSSWRLLKVLLAIVYSSDIPKKTRLKAIGPVLLFFLRESYRRARRDLRRYARATS